MIWMEHLRELGITDVIVFDTEFVPRSEIGKCVVPVFLGARSLVTGEQWRVPLLPFRPVACPLPVGDHVLYVGYALQAEWSVFRVMGWPYPTRCIDLFAEKMMETSHLDGEGNVRVAKKKKKRKQQ
jgi:hypothetical protein